MFISKKTFTVHPATGCFNFRQILLSGFYLVMVLAQGGVGCSEEEAQKIIVTSLRMDLSSDLVFDQIVKFKEVKGGKETQFGDGSLLNQDSKRSKQEAMLDQQFQALDRFEHPALDFARELTPKDGKKKENVEPVAPRDRKLIFAGKGFSIKDFETLKSEKLNTDFYSHLRAPLPEKLKKREPDHLDVKDKNLRSEKNLVFHPSAVISNSKQDRPSDEPEIPPSKKKTISTEGIPQTKVLLTQDPKGMIKLHSDKAALDLLVGDENVNVDQYQNR